MRILSVIIPNKNGEDLLRKFLPINLRRLREESSRIELGLEVIVVDGHSTDLSQAAVEELGGEGCQFVTFDGIPSYGAQLNHGVQIATGEFILILTTDIEISEGFLQSLLADLDASARIFSVSPKIQRPLEGGGVESLTRGKFRRNEIEVIRRTDGIKLDETREILWPCGAVFLTRRRDFLMLDGFSDEFLPGYSEDVDIGIRAWRRGLQCLYTPAAVAQHWHNSTFKKSGDNSVEFLLVRNHTILNLKHLPKSIKPLFFLKRLIRAIRHKNKLEFRGVLAGAERYWSFRRGLWSESMTLPELKALLRRIG